MRIYTKSKRKLNEVNDVSAVKQIANLNKYFGSKRTKMVTEQRERLVVDVEHIKDTLAETAKGNSHVVVKIFILIINLI